MKQKYEKEKLNYLQYVDTEKYFENGFYISTMLRYADIYGSAVPLAEYKYDMNGLDNEKFQTKIANLMYKLVYNVIETQSISPNTKEFLYGYVISSMDSVYFNPEDENLNEKLRKSLKKTIQVEKDPEIKRIEENIKFHIDEQINYIDSLVREKKLSNIKLPDNATIEKQIANTSDKNKNPYFSQLTKKKLIPLGIGATIISGSLLTPFNNLEKEKIASSNNIASEETNKENIKSINNKLNKKILKIKLINLQNNLNNPKKLKRTR